MPTTPASLVSQINDIYNPLLSGMVFDLNTPLEFASVDLIGDVPSFTPTVIPNIPAPTLANLTEGDNTLNGAGTFDVLMRAINKHVESQYKKGNLSQSEWAKVYVQAVEIALSQASNFVIASNNAAWQAETSKRQAELLEIQKATTQQEHRTRILETLIAKMAMARAQIDAHVSQGNLVGVKVKIGDTYHDILAKEATQELLHEQVDAARSQTKETLRSGATVAGSVAIDKSLKTKQLTLTDEQIDAARAQTKDTIKDGLTGVGGILGSQKRLYDQQKESFIHDSMNKAIKVLADAWTTQKTMDEGWTPPNAFLNSSIDPAVNKYLTEVGVNSGGLF